MDDFTLMFIAGVIILTMSLFLHLRKKQRLEAQRKAERRKAALDAREKAIRQQKQLGEPIKLKSVPTNSDRIPMPDAVGKTFTGSVSPQNIAKWEVEIHQIGRQVIGQIDSKMVALQTLTMEANRSANRLELLIEHLEQLVKASQKIDEVKEVTKNEMSESIDSDSFSEEKISNLDNYSRVLEELEEEIRTIPISSAQVQKSQEPDEVIAVQEKIRSTNLLPPDEIHENIERFADVLDSLESEIEDFQEDIEQLGSFSKQGIPSAKILKASNTKLEDQANSKKEQQIQNLNALNQKHANEEKQAETVENTRNVELLKSSEESQVSVSSAIRDSVRGKLGNPFALSSPRLPGGEVMHETKPSLPGNIKLKSHLEFQPAQSLPVPNPYMTSVSAKPLASGGTGKRITVGAAQTLTGANKSKRPANGLSVETLYQNNSANDSVELSGPSERSVPQLPSTGSHLTLRKQVEMLTQSGYTTNQIAQHLNITVGEVDLMLSLKN